MKQFDSAIGKVVNVRPKRYRALASRCGVFPYVINNKLVWQLRDEDEVFNQDSIDSFFDAAITIGHPQDDTQLDQTHGIVYNVDPIKQHDFNEPGIYCDFVVYTDEANSLAASSTPTSPMYDLLLVEKQGDYMGKQYDYIQKNIRYTSLGLVNGARQETTKVYYSLSKDSLNLDNNSTLLIDVPVLEIPELDLNMKTKLDNVADKLTTELIVPKPLEVPVTQSDTQEVVNEELENNESKEDNNETPEENTSQADTQEITSETTETQEDSSDNLEQPNDQPDEPNETPETGTNILISTNAVINSDGGINVNRDYLDESIDVARRASDMGLFSFNEAMMYSLSSINTLMRIILLKEGIETNDYDYDVRSAYKVYMKLRPLGNVNNSSITNSDSNHPIVSTISNSLSNTTTPKPILPNLNPKETHPIHAKSNQTFSNQDANDIFTFDDLE